MAKVSWGVLSTANIGTEKVIPAMQRGTYSEVNAIASRNLDKAKQAAKKLGIPIKEVNLNQDFGSPKLL